MIIKKFKIFESVDESVSELQDIFSDIDLEFPCNVGVYKMYISEYYIVHVHFESNGKIDIHELLNSIWEKINFAENMGFGKHIMEYHGCNKKFGYGLLSIKEYHFTQNVVVDDDLFENLSKYKPVREISKHAKFISMQINLKKIS
jgi:hypothetical protein